VSQLLRASRIRRRVIAVALLVAMATLGHDMVQAQSGEGRRKILKRTGFLGPQLSVANDGSVYLLWAKAKGDGFDLFVSVRQGDGLFSDPMQVNAESGTVEYSAIDELRPALATGSKGQAAIAWVDDAANIQAAIYDSQENTIRRWQLNRVQGNPVRGFVNLDFDDRGRLLAVWLDARGAKPGEEEPAHLYAVELKNVRAKAREKNLTEGWTQSVCGCCRPFVRSARGRFEVLVRNVTGDGYRDIHRGTGSFAEGLDAFDRVGPATWKIEACPMSGAVGDGNLVWWRDGSTGKSRIVEGSARATVLRVVVENDEEWTMTASPRLIEDHEDRSTMLLVPGRPYGKILRRDGGQWTEFPEKIPEWCNSAVAVGNELLLVGDEHSELKMESFVMAP
jgi:hypothetical protein